MLGLFFCITCAISGCGNTSTTTPPNGTPKLAQNGNDPISAQSTSSTVKSAGVDASSPEALIVSLFSPTPGAYSGHDYAGIPLGRTKEQILALYPPQEDVSKQNAFAMRNGKIGTVFQDLDLQRVLFDSLLSGQTYLFFEKNELVVIKKFYEGDNNGYLKQIVATYGGTAGSNTHDGELNFSLPEMFVKVAWATEEPRYSDKRECLTVTAIDRKYLQRNLKSSLDEMVREIEWIKSSVLPLMRSRTQELSKVTPISPFRLNDGKVGGVSKSGLMIFNADRTWLQLVLSADVISETQTIEFEDGFREVLPLGSVKVSLHLNSNARPSLNNHGKASAYIVAYDTLVRMWGSCVLPMAQHFAPAIGRTDVHVAKFNSRDLEVFMWNTDDDLRVYLLDGEVRWMRVAPEEKRKL